MEDMNFIVVLLAIVFAVFQIILFFKIWAMTNDVREMNNRMLKNDRDRIIRDAELAYLSGNPEIAKKILDKYLAKTISEEKENRFIEMLRSRRERIIASYEYLDLNIPEEKQ